MQNGIMNGTGMNGANANMMNGSNANMGMQHNHDHRYPPMMDAPQGYRGGYRGARCGCGCGAPNGACAFPPAPAPRCYCQPAAFHRKCCTGDYHRLVDAYGMSRPCGSPF